MILKTPCCLSTGLFSALLTSCPPFQGPRCPRHTPHAIAFSLTPHLFLLQIFTVWDLLYLNVQGWRLRGGDGGQRRAFGVKYCSAPKGARPNSVSIHQESRAGLIKTMPLNFSGTLKFLRTFQKIFRLTSVYFHFSEDFDINLPASLHFRYC